MTVFSLIILIVFLLFPMNTASSAKAALNLCLNSVIPSLFPFMVASKIIILSEDINENNLVFKMISGLFKISKKSVWAFLLGIICGYPIGAKTACDLLKERQISKKEAALLLCFCNNGGPAFIIATVGGMFFNSLKYGVIIYLSHILSSIIIGIAIGLFKEMPKDYKPQQKSKTGLPEIVTKAISEAVITMLNVVGIIVFFAAFYEALKSLNILSVFGDNPMAEGFICGLFEITSGIKKISDTTVPINYKLTAASFLMTFSGLSVFFQMLSFTSDLKIKITPCVICKVIAAFLSMLFTYLLLLI